MAKYSNSSKQNSMCYYNMNLNHWKLMLISGGTSLSKCHNTQSGLQTEQ